MPALVLQRNFSRLPLTQLTFLFEGEVLCEVAALVVAPQEEECGGVAKLQCPQVEDALQHSRMSAAQPRHTHLYTEVASVNIVAQEEVLGAGGRTANLEEFHQVIELTMDVSAD